MGHPEDDPDVSRPLFTLASCPVLERPDGAPLLWGKLKITVSPGSLAYSIYRKSEVEEAFNCNYELNPDFGDVIEVSGLRVSGVSEDGGARIIELPGHPFFMATGFMPQFTSEENSPHPLIISFLAATANFGRVE